MLISDVIFLVVSLRRVAPNTSEQRSRSGLCERVIRREATETEGLIYINIYICTYRVIEYADSEYDAKENVICIYLLFFCLHETKSKQISNISKLMRRGVGRLLRTHSVRCRAARASEAR